MFYPAAGKAAGPAQGAAGSDSPGNDQITLSDSALNSKRATGAASGRLTASGPATDPDGTVGTEDSGEPGAGEPAIGRTTTKDADQNTAGSDAVRPAPGRFPLVLFSHGLRGSPERYATTLSAWAAAGFVVAAPAYPHTCTKALPFERADIVNQPADAAYVIKMVRRLDRRAGDPLAGHIAVDRVAAVGHSAGGYTTTGLFVARHPTWLRAGVVIAGWSAPGAFAGPAATMLFLQGARDTVVPLATARAAYDAVPWTKSAMLLPDSWHADYMLPGGHAYPLMERTVIDFLRWTLNDDPAALQRLPTADPQPHP